MINECILVLCMCVSRDVLFCSEGSRYMPGVVKSVMGSDVFAGNGLVDLYVQCDEMESARKAFPEIADPSVVSYNALLAGNLEGDEGPWLFSEVRLLGMNPDHVTFSSILRNCKDVSIVAKLICSDINCCDFQDRR